MLTPSAWLDTVILSFKFLQREKNFVWNNYSQGGNVSCFQRLVYRQSKMIHPNTETEFAH